MSPLNSRAAVKDGRIVDSSAKRTKICIYAAGESRQDAPLEDDSWAVWALNAVAPIDSLGRLRCDRWFDLHQRCAQSYDDLKWIAASPVPIYLPDDLQDASPNAVIYPLSDIETSYGSYWACSFGYELALALFEGATEIALYGVDLALGDWRERTVEWACTSWWLGYAEAKGVVIRLPADSRLGRHPHRYGIEYVAEKEEVEQYGRAVRLGDLYRNHAQLKTEYLAHLPEKDREDDLRGFEDQPVGVGG